MSTAMIPSVAAESNDLPVLPLEKGRQICDRIRQLAARRHEQLTQLAETDEELSSCIQVAYLQRAWEEMGYASWEELCKREFSEARMWDTIEARRKTVHSLLLNVGMSTRAIAAVMGTSDATVRRDLATATNDAVSTSGDAHALATATNDAVSTSGDAHALATATNDAVSTQPPATAETALASSSSRKSRGLDGAIRQRPIGQELVDRRLLVAQKRAEGKTQAEIAAELAVTQRTVSNDTQALAQYKQKLDSDHQQRLDEGRLSRTELTELVGLTPVSSTQRAIVSAARSAAKGLSTDVEFLTENVVFNDSWLDAEAECSSILAPSLVSTIHTFAHWLGHEFRWDDVPEDKRMEYHDRLIEAAGALASATGSLVPEH